MAESRKKALKIKGVALGLLLVVGVGLMAQRLPQPLLEGAAGKQTHTAMVARNLYRGLASPLRPVVDDVGKPGYFVKELPVLATTAAGAYTALGTVDERILRLIPALAWLAGALALFLLLRDPLGWAGALTSCVWMIFAPMALVYAPSAMNDSLAVAGALGALWALARWRRRPALASALLVATATAFAFLLKPHTALWLGPAAAWLTLGFSSQAPARAPARSVAALVLLTGAALGLASLWYAHAAAIHRIYPVPGTTVAAGWVDGALLAHPELYGEIGRQALVMVFTIPGALVAAWGLARRARWSLIEGAFLWWGAGSLLQGLVFAPRMFDHLSRGTEYYQLPLVPVAAILIARGLAAIPPERWRAETRTVASLVILTALCAFGVAGSRSAATPPERYANLIPDCARVRAQTRAYERLLVLADRGGTVLYYCDRKGQTMVFGSSEPPEAITASPRARPDEIARAMADVGYLYVPFPELAPDPEGFFRQLRTHWDEVTLPGAGAGRLFSRRRNPTEPWSPLP